MCNFAYGSPCIHQLKSIYEVLKYPTRQNVEQSYINEALSSIFPASLVSIIYKPKVLIIIIIIDAILTKYATFSAVISLFIH